MRREGRKGKTRDMHSLHLFKSAIEDFDAIKGASQFNLKVMLNLSRLMIWWD